MSKNWKLPRRTFLKGLGACMALPTLEVMGDEAVSTQAPKRFLSMFMPNGVYPPNWDMEGTGYGLNYSPILKPLEAFDRDMSIISGLDSSGKGHIEMTNSFLSGLSRNKAKTPSIDQMIAKKIGQETRLPSLVVGTEPPRGGKVMASTVSWSSKSTMITPELNPQNVFDSMFKSYDTPEMKRLMNRRSSIIDSVLGQAKDLRKNISSSDRVKFDEYLSGVREVERRIQNLMDPKSSGKQVHAERPASGIPRDRNEHIDILCDLIVLGFMTETTHVGTVMMGHGFSRKSFTFLDGVTLDHHTMSHHKNTESNFVQYTKVSKWHVEKVARVLEKMKNIKEGDKTLLDNSLVLFGGGMKDGNGHIKTDLPLILAGSAGGAVKCQGRIVEKAKTPYANLLLPILNAYGMNYDKFADSQGKVDILA